MHTHHLYKSTIQWVIGKDYRNWTDIMFIYSPREDSCIFCRAALFIIKLNTQPSHCTDIFGLSKEVRTWQWFNLEGQLLPQTGSSLTSFQAFLSFWDAHWQCRNTVSDEVHGATVLPNPITVLPDLFTEEHFGWPQRAYHMHLHAATTAVTTSTLGTKCAMWIEWSSTCLSLNSLSVGKLQPPADEMFLKHVSNSLSNYLSINRMFLCCLHPQRSLS